MPNSHQRVTWLCLILTGGCAGPGKLASSYPTQTTATARDPHSRPAVQDGRTGLPSGRVQPVENQSSGNSRLGILTGAAPAVPLETNRDRAGLPTQHEHQTSVLLPKEGLQDQTVQIVDSALKPVAFQRPPPSPAGAHPSVLQAAGATGSNRETEIIESASALALQNDWEASAAPESSLIDGSFKLPVSPAIAEPIPVNLPSVLAAIDGAHPMVGLARWRVQQAYAQYNQSQVLWLPSIQAGFSFHRHDGNYQASNGDIVDVNRNSFQYGLGVGATGAGTTNTRPGVIAQFELADAIFLPKVSQKTAWARGHAAAATLNQQLLQAALAYFELVAAHQDLRIIEESHGRFSELTHITVDFAEAGEGLQADADRLKTELSMLESRLVDAEEDAAVASAELAQAISLDGNGTIVPMDVNAVPLDLVSVDMEKDLLIATALQTRPELKESQALVAAACHAFKQEKFAPFVPSVLLGFSSGGFGGGLGNDLRDIDARYDFDALLTWKVRNLGYGERAARRERFAQVQQARFDKLRVMDQVARDVARAHAQVESRRRKIGIALAATQTAEDCYHRNLERIRDGAGLPLENLQSAQALESAQRAYLKAIIDYNQAQIRLQWALGFPVTT